MEYSSKGKIGRTVLVIAAHPDDEVLGCGASIAKWSAAGDRVHILIMAEGATSRDEVRDRDAKNKELSQLAKSAQQAGDILGAISVKLLDFPDNRMDSVDLLGVIKTVEREVAILKPDTVVTHHNGDLNIDHRIVHQAVMSACRPQPLQSVKRILSFEVPSSTEWQSSTFGQAFIPNWFENISETMGKKIKAMEAYENEMRSWPHARSIRAGKHLAFWRGASVGCESVEAFMLVRQIK